MKVNKKEAALLQKAIKKWSDEALISQQQAEDLHNSYEETKFDWQSLSFYAFVFAIASIIISGVALLADKWLMQLFDKIVDASDEYKAVFFAISSGILFFYGQKIRRNKADNVYSHTALNLLGIMTSAVALGYFSIVFGNGEGHFSVFIFIAAGLYGILGFRFKSKMLWITALLSFLIWYGVETSYLSNWQPFFLGMNIIVRFIPFCLLVIAVLFFIKNYQPIKNFYNESLVFFSISFFGALWLASIFGNESSLASWSAVSQTNFLYWSAIFFLTSLISIWIGIKYRQNIFRELGIIFLIINFYSRYFEFGWEMLHPTVFFACLGLSFWFIGKKAEKIWTLSDFKKS